MVGYIKHSNVTIRFRSNGFDVPLEGGKTFVPFGSLDAAKAFIDAGRNTEGHTVYDMQTQAPVAN